MNQSRTKEFETLIDLISKRLSEAKRLLRQLNELHIDEFGSEINLFCPDGLLKTNVESYDDIKFLLTERVVEVLASRFEKALEER